MSASDDEQHLNLLSIFHYVVGGIALLVSLFPIIHLVVGITIVTGRMEGATTNDPFSQVIGWLFIGIAIAMIAGGITYSICTFVAARSLRHRRRYTFCLVIGAVSCIFFPFGTVLGIFTILVLSRPTVKPLFAPVPPAAER